MLVLSIVKFLSFYYYYYYYILVSMNTTNISGHSKCSMKVTWHIAAHPPPLFIQEVS